MNKKKKVKKRNAKIQNVGILAKQNSKIIRSYDRLRARKFRARRKSLRAQTFLRPGEG